MSGQRHDLAALPCPAGWMGLRAGLDVLFLVYYSSL